MDRTEVARWLMDARESVVERVSVHQYGAVPVSPPDHLEARARRSYRDRLAEYLEIAVEAVACGEPDLFAAHLSWVRGLNTDFRYPPEGTEEALLALSRAARRLAPDALREPLCRLLEESADQFCTLPSTVPSHLSESGPLGGLPQDYLGYLLAGRRDRAFALVHGAVRDGATVVGLYHTLFEPVQYEIGRLWQLNQVSVAHEHYCTGANSLLMTQLYDRLVAERQRGRGSPSPRPTVLVACVEGNLHDFGCRMVADIVAASGYDVAHLGAGTPAPAIARFASERRARTVCLSASMPNQIASVAEAVETLHALELAPTVLVGGRIFRAIPRLARLLGADGTAEEPLAALDQIASLSPA